MNEVNKNKIRNKGFLSNKFKWQKKSQKRNTANEIKYYRMLDDGICEIEEGIYSKTLKFSDINYQTARNDEQIELFSRYCEILNFFDETTHVQISIQNKRIDSDNFKSTMLLEENNDNLNEYRLEMNDMLKEKALEGQNNIMREKFITFTTRADSYNMAIQNLARIEADLSGLFKSINSDIQSLSGSDRLSLIQSITRPTEKFTFQYTDLLYSNLSTKDFIAPSSFDFSDKKSMQFGEKTGSVLYIRDYPSELSDKILSDLSDIPIDMNISLHIEAVDQTKAIELVQKQIAFMEMEATEKQDKAVSQNRNPDIAVPMETRRAHKEALKLLELLQERNQRMLKLTVLVFTFADTKKELEENIEKIKASARKKNLKLEELSYRQKEGFNSILPIGKNHVDIKRTLTTTSTAIYIPFTGVELYQENGMYYGLNALSRNLIFFSRYNLKAPNGVILGTPGSGKSFAAKREMINVLLKDPNAEVIVIDPEREYTNLAKGFDGEVIYISSGSKNYINPMDINMDYADDEDPLSLKSEFILTIAELLIGGKEGLKGTGRSIISRACKLCYSKYFANPNKHKVPTLRDLYEKILEQPEPEAKAIALELEIYIDGALSVFANETNVDTKKRFCVFDVRDLGKQLRTFGMIVVLDQIWNKITTNRTIGKRTWIYVDEFQLLLSNEYSAVYFFELWSRARKWGAVPTGITQNVETLLLSDLARRMLSNSDFIMMFNQAAPDREQLSHILNISELQLSHVTNSEPGHGLLFAGKSIIPFIDKFPRESNLYQMMTTKIEEVIKDDK